MGWLVPPSGRLPSPNRYHDGYKPEWVRPVECVIMHYTGGYGYMGSARWLANKIERQLASAHFVIGRAGELVQLVPVNERAWHAGGKTSRWNGRSVNSRSIGVELANLGPLERHGGALKDAWGRTYQGRTVAGEGKLWEPYPEAQLACAEWLVSELAQRFPVLSNQIPWQQGHAGADGRRWTHARICGHQEVDPTRKTDPGPAFPWERFR